MRRLPAAAALLAAALLGAACSSGSGGAVITKTVPAPAAGGAGSSAAVSTAVPSPSSSSAAPKPKPRVVHVSSLISDGATYGIGMPVVLFFSPLPTSSAAFTHAVKVTVNGRPADGAWFWEQPTADEVASHTVEAHYRLAEYWPAHAHVHVSLPIAGRSAGPGLVFSGKLTSLDFDIGDAHITTVNGATERMQVRSNGKVVRSFQVSLGKASTPTFTGTKVVMQKGEQPPGSSTLRPDGAVRMRGPGYDELVDWSVRITRSGEYIHAAPWNSEIGRVSTSNGCTNLSTANADWYYHFAQVGDVATYRNTGGGPMPSWDGFGDWNVTWPQWQAGGLLRTH